MRSLDLFAEQKLAYLEERALRRRLSDTVRTEFPTLVQAGRRLVSFSCNDYLGLSQHPHVKAAAAAAVDVYGAGGGASRLVTGNCPLYDALENRLAAAKGTEAACVFGSGYLANIGAIGVLAGAEDLIVIDELAHACLNAGAQLSRARVIRFRHNDLSHAAAILGAHRTAHRHALIVTETVFSMDGDLAPIENLGDLAATHDAWLMTDDAHGFHSVPHPTTTTPAPVQVGTLSKALGSYGGYLCASAQVVALMTTRARSLIYSTALPPASVAAALAALDVIAAEPALVDLPRANARRFTARLGLPPAQSAIVPLVLGGAEAALTASARLAEAGFLVTAIRPPTVPEGSARLRFAFSAAHSEADIDRLAEAVGRLSARAPLPTDDLCPASS